MKKVGVIVGRFQVPELHAGHRYLIDTVMNQCDEVLLVLGQAQTISERNPFSKEARWRMLKTAYPKVRLAEIDDQLSDEKWSRKLDRIISDLFPKASASLYGSRDSFLLVYSGRFPTVYIPPLPAPSGTDIRKRFFAKKGKGGAANSSKKSILKLERETPLERRAPSFPILEKPMLSKLTPPIEKRIPTKILALGLVFFILFLASEQFQSAFFSIVFWLKSIISLYPLLGAMLFLLLSGLSAMFAFASSLILLPSALLAWGPEATFALLFGGWILGAALAYGIGSRFIHPLLAPLVPEDKLPRYRRIISADASFVTILLFCLSVPSEIPGYILGAARYHFGKFMLAMALTEAVYALGAVLVAQNLLSQKYSLVIGSLAILSLIAVAASTFFVRKKRPSTQKPNVPSP